MAPFKRVLVANRGEIALRVIRACHEEGLEAVAVYSDADRLSPHVRAAHVAVPIGPPPAAESYLDIAKLIEAARTTECQAVHPGYGFLSERAPFAEAVTQAGLTFVGPPATAIRTMGDKTEARRRMQAAGVPIVPGSTRPVLDHEQARAVALGERECSIQRRHQKLIEEAPSVAVTPALRRRLSEAATAAVGSVGYLGAGTVEFLLAPTGEFYFLEMNTRLQVEHPVTELVFGVDIVREQLRVAQGQPLRVHSGALQPRGHAIECRITAEDPFNDFLPATGMIRYLQAPSGPGVRWDGGVEAGNEVTLYYDALLAKLIVWGDTRAAALQRMRRRPHRPRPARPPGRSPRAGRASADERDRHDHGHRDGRRWRGAPGGRASGVRAPGRAGRTHPAARRCAVAQELREGGAGGDRGSGSGGRTGRGVVSALCERPVRRLPAPAPGIRCAARGQAGH